MCYTGKVDFNRADFLCFLNLVTHKTLGLTVFERVVQRYFVKQLVFE